MSLPPDLIELLCALTAAGVRFLVVGGHAVSLHARPRSTKDLDLWLDAAPENIARACDALLRFGVPEVLVAELRCARSDEIVWLGRAPARVDLLQELPGATFEESWLRHEPLRSRRVERVPLSGAALPLAHRLDGEPHDEPA